MLEHMTYDECRNRGLSVGDGCAPCSVDGCVWGGGSTNSIPNAGRLLEVETDGCLVKGRLEIFDITAHAGPWEFEQQRQPMKMPDRNTYCPVEKRQVSWK